VGILEQGAAVKEVSTKGNWLEIEAPAGAYAFVAASFVRQAPTEATVPPVVSLAPPETATVPVAPEIATTPTDTTGVVAMASSGTEPAPVPFPDATDAAPPPAVIEEFDVPRYVYGRHIIVSGEEGLDKRWTNTPVLTIQKIYVVE
jgi:hypothetical protein